MGKFPKTSPVPQGCRRVWYCRGRDGLVVCEGGCSSSCPGSGGAAVTQSTRAARPLIRLPRSALLSAGCSRCYSYRRGPAMRGRSHGCVILSATLACNSRLLALRDPPPASGALHLHFCLRSPPTRRLCAGAVPTTARGGAREAHARCWARRRSGVAAATVAAVTASLPASVEKRS